MEHLQNVILLLFFIMLLIIVQIQFSCSRETYSNHASCIASERRALVEFREGLIDNANRLSSWSGEDCCTWKGVSCNNLTGHVVKLELGNPMLLDDSFIYYEKNQLGGKLSPSLLQLKHLQYLDLSMNNFWGVQIPKFLGSLKTLRYLDLSDAYFFGNIPSHLGNLTSLQYLNLGSFYSTSSLTTKSLQWVAQLSSLKSLNLYGVHVEESKDWLNWVAMLPSLSSLNLGSCRLDLTFPASPPPFPTLASLDLDANEAQYSTIPLGLFNSSSLVNLNLARNNLQGSIASFKNLISLASLDLSFNHLTSSPLDTLCNLTSLVQMNLQGNIIQGSLPICLGNLTSLTYLNLGSNDIKGSIPSSLGQLTQLIFLELSYNQLTGTIPSTIGQLKMLKVFDISSNFLSGRLSELHFEKLTELKRLYTTSNQLKLNVSIQWIPPFQLEIILMGFTQTGPQFPQWLRTQKNVETLTMSDAGISDTIPNWFANVFSHISYLDLSNNNLSGEIPKFLRAKNNYLEGAFFLNSNKFEGLLKPFPPNTRDLDLSGNFLAGPIHPLFGGNMTTLSLGVLMLGDNQLSGNIPDDICNIPTLNVIYLPNNQLSGRIPPCLGRLRQLQFLVLSNNSFSGHVPSVLGDIENLNTLHLSENKFYGQLPSSLQNLKKLENLDLGGNQLKGTIPWWIGKELSQLKFLRLQSNNFYGDIPLEICQLSILQVLNLAQNKLTGLIPHCFQNLSAMASNGTTPNITYWFGGSTDSLSITAKGRYILYTKNLKYVKSMVLSDNRLIGEIPNELMELVGLQSLDLSNNSLSGIIPAKIGNMKQLESLDLARNQLSGAIPPNLANINSLSYLNLSFNNLSGRIPSGNQLQTLNEESIYEGNSGLCGKPLPNSCPDDKSSKGIDGHVDDDENDDGFEVSWFYAGIGQGFAVGLIGVLCIFHFNKSLRYAYFQFLEDVHNKISTVIALKISKLKRMFN